jgi:hypothetical protein
MEKVKELTEYELQQRHFTRKLENTQRILASKKLRLLRTEQYVNRAESVLAAAAKVRREGGRVILPDVKQLEAPEVTDKMLDVAKEQIARLKNKITPIKERLQTSKKKNGDEERYEALSEQLGAAEKELEKLKELSRNRKPAGEKKSEGQDNGKQGAQTPLIPPAKEDNKK